MQNLFIHLFTYSIYLFIYLFIYSFTHFSLFTRAPYLVFTLAPESFVFQLVRFPPPLKSQHFRNLVQTGPNVLHASLKACLHGGGGPQIGEVICGGSPHLSCKRDQIKMRNYMNGQVTSPKRVTSPSWVSPPPCKQALNHNPSFLFYLSFSL